MVRSLTPSRDPCLTNQHTVTSILNLTNNNKCNRLINLLSRFNNSYFRSEKAFSLSLGHHSSSLFSKKTSPTKLREQETLLSLMIIRSKKFFFHNKLKPILHQFAILMQQSINSLVAMCQETLEIRMAKTNEINFHLPILYFA